MRDMTYYLSVVKEEITRYEQQEQSREFDYIFLGLFKQSLEKKASLFIQGDDSNKQYLAALDYDFSEMKNWDVEQKSRFFIECCQSLSYYDRALKEIFIFCKADDGHSFYHNQSDYDAVMHNIIRLCIDDSTVSKNCFKYLLSFEKRILAEMLRGLERREMSSNDLILLNDVISLINTSSVWKVYGSHSDSVNFGYDANRLRWLHENPESTVYSKRFDDLDLAELTDEEVVRVFDWVEGNCAEDVESPKYHIQRSYEDFYRKLFTKYNGKTLSDPVEAMFKGVLKTLANFSYYDVGLSELLREVRYLLFVHQHGKEADFPEYFLAPEGAGWDFPAQAKEILDSLSEHERLGWNQLLTVMRAAKAGKPSAKFMKETASIIEETGKSDVEKTLIRLLEQSIDVPMDFNDVKSLVWLTGHFLDSENVVRAAAKLAESQGSGKLCNMCLNYLGEVSSLPAVQVLSRLQIRLKHAQTKKLITKHLTATAKALNMTVNELEDLCVDDFGLTKGEKEILLSGFIARIVLEKPGQATLSWFDGEGKPRKTVPSVVKSDHADDLKALKADIKQIGLISAAQRDRLDRMYRAERQWSYSQFESLYLNHGLMSTIATKLVWNLHQGDQVLAAFYLDGIWVNELSQPIEFIHVDSVTMWHPALAEVGSVQTWREFMSRHEVRQPLKQAYREIYLLTDAEITTKSYSNRMAAHILKQHQLSALAKQRGWQYTLMGSYDDGIDNTTANIVLPEFNLRAEFWIDEVDTGDDQFNDMGIWYYVATDQVRFINTETNNAVDLVDVPTLVFSEIFRDVDLFVGVSSVGNDPEWQDSRGTTERARDYWRGYSFGDLSEMAKTRKTVLSFLLPKLKIADAASIDGNFLVVKGKVRTYKIHIGSSNILMAPNDEYLCIVPTRSKKDVTDNMFMPFEGDRGLSLVLSKALMLADDHKIKDTTILSQIQREAVV